MLQPNLLSEYQLIISKLTEVVEAIKIIKVAITSIPKTEQLATKTDVHYLMTLRMLDYASKNLLLLYDMVTFENHPLHVHKEEIFKEINTFIDNFTGNFN